MPKKGIRIKIEGKRAFGMTQNKMVLPITRRRRGEELARNSKGNGWRLFVHDPPQNCSMLEEE
jgi:hypothetical protein